MTKVAAQGDNGLRVYRMRGLGSPTFTPAPFRDLGLLLKGRAPICFNPVASRTVLPLQELRARLGMEGKHGPNCRRVQAAYAKGELPKMENGGHSRTCSLRTRTWAWIGPWHPHMMLYSPYYENSMLAVTSRWHASLRRRRCGNSVRRDRNPMAHALAVKTQVNNVV